MKYTVALALLGANAVTIMRRTNGEVILVQDSEIADSELLQLGIEEVDHSNEYFKPGQHEMLGNLGPMEGGYERVTPARFAADTDDIFMRSMIE